MSNLAVNDMDIVQRALDALKTAGADKASVSFSRGEKSELNVETGRMSLYRTTINVSLHITAHLQTRKGSVWANRYDDETVEQAVTDAVAMARSSEPDPANDIAPARPMERFEDGPTEPDSDAMYDRLKEFLEHVSAHYPSVNLEQCILDFGRDQQCWANSNGAGFQGLAGAYGFQAMFTSKEGTHTSSFNYSGASHRSLIDPLKDWANVDELMRQSTEQTRASSIDGAFEGDVIVTPDCLGDIIGALVGTYMGDRALITGTSPWKNRLDDRVSSPLFTLRSMPNGPDVEIGYRWTGDGFRAENCTLIESGVLRNFTLGLYGSNKTGRPRCPSGGGALAVDAGNSTLADMVASVERGILLARFSGGSPADNGDFSGVAKNSYLIENGAIVRPVVETMIAGNVGQLFGAIRAISKERVDYGQAVFPWVLAGGVSISGK